MNMTDEAREIHILELGKLFIKAAKEAEASHSARDKAEARRLLDLQNKAISERSEAQITRLEVERGLDEGVNYFAAMGQKHAAEMAGVQQ